ncbi:hypothetical protein ColLi_12720 [Colletotrichum liriopes]|uniref:Uncharacterized protein n=1 Tax=Colletotrichum liriopes TaxID=708192 RepID=A0AA37H0W4_9PEZI|nr:hypothetical protein ColLi_12720 [Colletotrichum liriopes]
MDKGTQGVDKKAKGLVATDINWANAEYASVKPPASMRKRPAARSRPVKPPVLLETIAEVSVDNLDQTYHSEHADTESDTSSEPESDDSNEDSAFEEDSLIQADNSFRGDIEVEEEDAQACDETRGEDDSRAKDNTQDDDPIREYDAMGNANTLTVNKPPESLNLLVPFNDDEHWTLAVVTASAGLAIREPWPTLASPQSWSASD